MKPPESFETLCLHLRRPTMDDAEQVFQGYAQDPAVSKYMIWRPHQDIDTTRAFLDRCAHCWRDGTAFPWLITGKEEGAPLGIIELRIDGHRADLGYGIARRDWGNGYTTEAVEVIVQWAMAQESIYRVWATCDVENLASARVLEKAGLQKEGILRRYIVHPNVSSEPRDCFCFAIVK